MTAYVITYDLSEPERNYDDLYERIKSYGSWAHVVESTWMVATSGTARSVRDHLKDVLDSNDKLFVGKVSAPAAWAGLSKDVADWLKKNL